MPRRKSLKERYPFYDALIQIAQYVREQKEEGNFSLVSFF